MLADDAMLRFNKLNKNKNSAFTVDCRAWIFCESKFYDFSNIKKNY